MASRAAPQPRMARVDTLGLKNAIDAALPASHASVYWQTLADFVAGRLARVEFQELALQLLGSEHIQLHNDLLVGVLYNASPGVPGPTTAHRFAHSARTFAETGWDSEEDCRPPPHKRLRAMVAGLTKRERAALKALGGGRRTGPGGGFLGEGSADPSLEWAGMAADLLERKRKEDDRRRTVEEKKRFRETRTAIGARDWHTDMVAGQDFVEAAQPRLPASIQQALQRAALAPSCLTAKELPDTETLRDRMTLVAVKHGLTQGVHPQAASMLLLALQNHLQTIASLTLRKLRPPQGMESDSPSSERREGRTLALPDVGFALDATPASAVEPPGLGPAERLTMPDWAEEAQVERETMSVRGRQCAYEARSAALAKLSAGAASSYTPAHAGFSDSTSNGVLHGSSHRLCNGMPHGSPAPGGVANPPATGIKPAAAAAAATGGGEQRRGNVSAGRRARYAVDTLAPARLVQPPVSSPDAKADLPEETGGSRAYHLWEVVDPVALLSSL